MRIDVKRHPLGLAIVVPTVLVAQAAFAQLQPPPPPQDPAQLEPVQPAPVLTPPAPVELPAQDAETYRQLEQAEREDSGRRLQFVWLAPEVGFEWAALDQLSNDNLIDSQVKPGAGLAFGGTAGLRWLFYTVGARFRYGMLNEFTMWSIGGDAALRVPLGNFEPFVMLGGGYHSLSDFAANDALRAAGATDDLAISGFSARLGGGFDYYVTPVFSAGISVDAEALFLSRDRISADTDTPYDSSGSGVGLAVTSMAVLALHF
jgi:hypothetical protein